MLEKTGKDRRVTFPARWLCDVLPKRLKLSSGREGPAKTDHRSHSNEYLRMFIFMLPHYRATSLTAKQNTIS